MPSRSSRKDQPNARYSFEGLLRSDEPPGPSPSNDANEAPPPPRSAPSASTRSAGGTATGLATTKPRSRVALTIALVATLLGGLLIAGLILTVLSDDGDDLETPIVESNSCSAAGFASLLPGSDSDDVTLSGDPRCEGPFAAVPLQRSTGAGAEELIGAFRIGSEQEWEHFATVKTLDCPSLAQIEPGFPETLCAGLG